MVMESQDGTLYSSLSGIAFDGPAVLAFHPRNSCAAHVLANVTVRVLAGNSRQRSIRTFPFFKERKVLVKYGSKPVSVLEWLPRKKIQPPPEYEI